MDNAFNFIEFNGGLCVEADYPYVSGSTERQGTCHQKNCKKVALSTPKSYTDVEVNSEVRYFIHCFDTVQSVFHFAHKLPS